MNTFVIEQSKEESQLAISLQQNAEMGDIRLAHTKATAISPEEAMKESIAISMNVTAKQFKRVNDQLKIEVDFRLSGSRKSDSSKAKPVIRVECVFEASYRLKPGFEPTKEQILAFKDGNAIYNCWPFCRQYVHETIMQLGYPPITLPFLRVVTKASKKREVE